MRADIFYLNKIYSQKSVRPIIVNALVNMVLESMITHHVLQFNILRVEC